MASCKCNAGQAVRPLNQDWDEVYCPKCGTVFRKQMRPRPRPAPRQPGKDR